MENIFEKGNKITSNDMNLFEVIDTNECQVVCRDLLNDDFSVFSKTEYKFKRANIKIILRQSLREIIEETEISEKDKEHILLQMDSRITNWL